MISMALDSVCNMYKHVHALLPRDVVKIEQMYDNRLTLKVIYQPLYSMNIFVTNKSKLPQDGAQVFPYMG